ncbi:MAG: hypothetical protein M3347_06670 [Armatimonadota bacterium]|nr:hypothetical protein [Armatimonadota bacterium]
MRLTSLALCATLLGWPASGAGALETVKGQPLYPRQTGAGSIYVLDYEVDYRQHHYEDRRDDDRRRDRYDDYSRRRRYRGDDIGQRLATEVVQQLLQSGRFEVYNRDRTVRWPFPLELESSGAVSAETARQMREASGVQYVVSGVVDIEVTVREYEEKSYDRKDKDGKRRERVRQCYETKVDVEVRHVATDTSDGAIWRQLRQERSQSKTFYDDEPDDRDIDDLVLKASRGTVQGFVRQLVPEVEGQVVGKNRRSILINLGKAHGVGLDVDFTFYRWVEVRDAAGQVPTDPETGQPLRRKVPIQLRPSPKHKEPFPVIGRPVQIDDSVTAVNLGYNGSGGFFGPEYEFKPRDNFLAEIREGDIAVLTPRPPDAK